jgi:hypothetical protein
MISANLGIQIQIAVLVRTSVRIPFKRKIKIKSIELEENTYTGVDLDTGCKLKRLKAVVGQTGLKKNTRS